MKLANVLVVLAAVLAAGCASEDPASQGSSVRGDGSRGERNGACTKIEGSDIGENLSLAVGGQTVSITGWLSKDGEPNEYRGFSITTSGPVTYTVKAGGERFASSDPTWQNPNGTGGSAVSGISNIELCDDDCTDPDGCEPGGGGDQPDDDDPCTDPDDCTETPPPPPTTDPVPIL